ncbi:TetR family transcriptional regulator C-terminal domain-containing protein, partial [Caballeronia sordidicola]
DPQTPSRLCMFAAMTSEEVLAEPDLRERVEQGMKHFDARVAQRLREDQDKGILDAALDPRVVAQVITTYLQGVWRMAVVDYNRPRFERQIDAFLSGLGL